MNGGSRPPAQDVQIIPQSADHSDEACLPADYGVEDADDTLIVLFMCCHPALTGASQIALTLRALGGLTTAEVARALLVPEEP